MYLCGEFGAPGSPGLATLPMAQGHPPHPINLLRIPMPKVGSTHYPYTAAGKRAAAAARKAKRKTKPKTKTKSKTK